MSDGPKVLSWEVLRIFRGRATTGHAAGMNLPVSASPPALDEVSDVISLVDAAPRVAVVPGWHLEVTDDLWRIAVNGCDNALSGAHQVLVGAGVAVEHVVVALEARGHRVDVQILPAADPHAAATVRCVGRRRPSQVQLAIRHAATSGPPHTARAVRPSDLRVLNLTAEALSTEVMWSNHVSEDRALRGQQRVHPDQDAPPFATIVTHGDTPPDWVRAGRALARLFLRATSLGLDVHQELQSLSQPSTRAQLRELWGLSTVPQAQFGLTSGGLTP